MKKFTAKRLLSLVLATVMLLSLGLTGCNPQSNPTDDTTKRPEGTTVPEGMVLYSFTAKGQGATPLSGVTITLTDAQGIEAASGVTDAKGEYSVWLYPAEYTARITDGLADGANSVAVKTTAEGGSYYLSVGSVITEFYPNQPASYSVGDVFYDFSFLNVNGEEVKLSELLETKKLVIINFWATWCSPCKNEFPAIQKAYEMYGDDVEIVAFSTSDTATKCDTFREENGYTFTMTPDIGLYSRFSSVHGGGSIPCTIFVDRYGMIAYSMVGGSSKVSDWTDIMEKFISDDYTPDMDFDNDDNPDDEVEQEKPDVEMPDSSKIEAAINGTNSDNTKFSGTYYASEDEYVWPWVVTEDGKAIEPSNYGKDSTNAMINMDLEFKKGQVFAFDFEYSIDYDQYGTQIYDFLAVYVDGHVMQTMYTKQNGKVTCYAYTPTEDGTHTVTIVYSKDSSTWEIMEAGNEYVHVSDLRMVSVEDMTAAGGNLNVWTPAADVVADENATTEYENYVDVVLAADGYYHVGSEDGPLLLTKLYGSSQWSSSSLYALGYYGYLKIDGIDYYSQLAGNEDEGTTKTYLWLEQNSDLGYTPVDSYLAKLLNLFAANIGDGKNHDKEWLEFCCYFTHYGAGEGVTKVTDVRQGIDFISAFEAKEGKNYVNVNRTLVPMGVYYKFVPDKSGVYAFYSIADGATTSSSSGIVNTMAWLFNAAGEDIDEYPEGKDGHFRVLENMVAGETYYIAATFANTEDLGSFYFQVEYLGDPTPDMDEMNECSAGYTTDDDGNMIIWRQFGIQAALGEDGYYHQLLSDGTLDMSEHGYIYIDFLKDSELTSHIPYVGDICNLYDYITKGYYQECAAELVIDQCKSGETLKWTATVGGHYVLSGFNGTVSFYTEEEYNNNGTATTVELETTVIYLTAGQTYYFVNNGETTAELTLLSNGDPVCGTDGKAILFANAFDFTQRTDSMGNSLADLGNHQAEMEAYLKLAMSGNESDFDYGYVKADEKLVEIINCIVALYGEGCEDEWLMAASFAKHP